MAEESESFSFERLSVWQDARELTKSIYAATKTFPREETFGLRSQVCRAAVSVASNIAEGTSRRTYAEKIRFIEIAYGSLMEAFCQLKIASDLEMLDSAELKKLRPKFFEIAKKLGALKKVYVESLPEFSKP